MTARALLACAATAALLAACGTTVPLTSTRATGSGGANTGLGNPLEGGAGGNSTTSTGSTGGGLLSGSSATGGTTPGQGSAAGWPGGPSGSTSGAGSATSQSSGRPGSSNVPGVTSKEVKIGVERIDTAALGAFANSAGVKAGIGNLNGFQDALIAWVNRSGGLAGRKLTPVFFQANLSASNQSNDAARCATWAEDNHVYAAQAGITEGTGAVPCLAKHGVVSINTLETAPGSVDDFNRYRPYYYAPSATETVSLARSYVTGLHSAGFFQPSAKIGLLYFDYPEFRVAKERGLKPALARLGLSVSSEYSVSYSGNPAEAGNISAAVSSAELKFASVGVKKVLFLDSGGTLALFFMENAQNQHQAFDYGLNSTSDAAFLEGQSGISSQLPRSVVAGVQPARDSNDLGSAPRNPDRDRCFAILRAAGFVPGSAVDRQTMTEYCAFYFFLKATFDRASSFGPRGFAAAAASLGHHPGTAAASNGDDFSTGLPWGAARYGIATWRADCSCFKYTGNAHPF